jgi:hypothetical protein
METWNSSEIDRNSQVEWGSDFGTLHQCSSRFWRSNVQHLICLLHLIASLMLCSCDGSQLQRDNYWTTGWMSWTPWVEICLHSLLALQDRMRSQLKALLPSWMWSTCSTPLHIAWLLHIALCSFSLSYLSCNSEFGPRSSLSEQLQVECPVPLVPWLDQNDSFG